MQLAYSTAPADWDTFVLDRNTWNYITVSKLSLLDRNSYSKPYYFI